MNIILERKGQELKQSTLKGKMERVPSLSTSPLLNSSCEKFRKIKANSICKSCYSVNSLGIYKNLRSMLAVNSEILSQHLTDDEIKRAARGIHSPLSGLFRFESHGDILNEAHLNNLVRIAALRPDISFALWTKRYSLAENYFDKHKKPKNLEVVYSSLLLNRPINKERFNHCNKIFTVYSKDGVKQKGVTINCGGKKCNDCRFCYTGTGPQHINELIK
tara:strand:- start:148 stop:804 length:657 start_codon:yes stop_codon:yes gene_type:complete